MVESELGLLVLGEGFEFGIGERPEAERLRGGRCPRSLGGFAGWVIVDDEFEATADDLVETHLVVGRDTFGGGGEVIGDLDLDCDHGEGARVRASMGQGAARLRR